MSQNLLTATEIVRIVNEVNSNPQWSVPNMMGFDLKRKDGILAVSPLKGIIIVAGNSATGFHHIKERHDFWSNHSYFKPHEEDFKVDNPSKFGRKSIPIMDYQNISDQLYDHKNLSPDKNKSPDLFDLYIGKVVNENNGDGIYQMLLYKDTRILHTIYPKSKSNNETKKGNKILKYAKGKVQSNIHFNPLTVVIGVPYRDRKGIPMYSFEIIRNYEEKMEYGIVRDLKREGHFDIYSAKIEEEFDQHKLEIEIDYFRFRNLTQIERFIQKYDTETYDN